MPEEHLREMIRRSEKVRHALEDGRIRARYGHSTPETLEREAYEPPDVLFHGTDDGAAKKILVEGLQSMTRQNVYLSADRETARRVGLRKSKAPVILVVSARKAFASRVRFYRGNASVWLADVIPAELIEPEVG